MTIRDALEEGGFSVVQATTAEQALEMLDAEGADYKSLITDVNLGSRTPHGMGRRSPCPGNQPRHPRYLYDRRQRKRMGGQGVPNSVLLVKPFAPAQVETAVSHLLNVGPGQ